MSLVARFDRFVGAAKQPQRHREAEGLGGLEVDDERVPGPRLHRKVGRSLTLEDAIDVADRATGLVEKIGVVGRKTASSDAKLGWPGLPSFAKHLMDDWHGPRYAPPLPLGSPRAISNRSSLLAFNNFLRSALTLRGLSSFRQLGKRTVSARGRLKSCTAGTGDRNGPARLAGSLPAALQ
jgi:hypothetical protein